MPCDPLHRELLLAVAQRPRQWSAEQLAGMAAGVRSWDTLIGLAREHRLSSLLWLGLSEAGAALPPAAEAALRADYQRNAFCSLANAAELIAILKRFGGEGIVALPFKGVVLAAAVWGDLASRPAGDLDLLIRYEDLGAATDMLRAEGYELTTAVRPDGSPADSDCHEYHFERRRDGMVVELRWQLDHFPFRFGRQLGLEWLWPRRCTARLAGAPVPDMPAELKLIVLSMHASKHLWSRLIWVCDLAQLIAVSPELDWEKAMQEAASVGLARAVRVGVLLAYSLAGAQPPEGVIRSFQADRTARRLARHFEQGILEAPGVGPAGWVPYSVQVLDAADRMRYLLSLELLRPNEHDRSFLRLPKWLEPLYFLLRPVRLLLDRSPR